MYSFADLKNPNLALNAVRILQERLSQIRFISFGAYPESENYPLPENTEFHLRPDQTKINDHYAACDAWIFSSNHEGFGLPLLEAMACRERTPEAIANALEDILRLNQESWQFLSDNTHKKAQHYNWHRSGQQFEAALYKAAA